jgi:hypothetical protein
VSHIEGRSRQVVDPRGVPSVDALTTLEVPVERLEILDEALKGASSVLRYASDWRRFKRYSSRIYRRHEAPDRDS